MVNFSLSPSLCEVAASAFTWPHSTKPWVVTTLVVGADDGNAYMQTMSAASGLQMASSLAPSDCVIVSIQCYSADDGRWRRRDVTEILVGMVGEAAVAVFRDEQGNDFCPDAPVLPATRVRELVSVGSVVGLPSRDRASAAMTLGRQLHRGFVRDFAVSRDPAPLAEGAEPTKDQAHATAQP
jgi:hypothetical protein